MAWERERKGGAKCYKLEWSRRGGGRGRLLDPGKAGVPRGTGSLGGLEPSYYDEQQKKLKMPHHHGDGWDLGQW